MLKYQSPFSKPHDRDDPSFSMFDKGRPSDDVEIRTASDVQGKALLELKKQENSLGYRMREKYLPELPGYKPDKLVNRYQMEKYLEKLLETKMHAQLISHKVPGAVCSAILGAFTKEAGEKGLWSTIALAWNGPIRAVRRSLDVLAEAKKGEVELHQKFNEKKVEYLSIQQDIMMAEKRDWQQFRRAEQERGYMAPNRMEWFQLGNALHSIHQDVEFKTGDIDKFIREINARVEGASTRRQADIVAPFLSGALGAATNRR